MAAETGVRNGTATKGLFFIFTLLSLICFTSSFFQDQLVNIKKNHEELKEQLDQLKNKDLPPFIASSGLLGDYINLMEPTIAMMKNWKEDDEDDYFSELESFLEKTKSFLKKTKVSVDKMNDEFCVQIRDLEERIKNSETLINFLEQQHAEL